MMTSREQLADSFFRCNDRERAAFEAGIKLGTVYHQFIGTPVSIASVDDIEDGIEAAISTQPFVESVRVRVSRDSLPPKEDLFSYVSLQGEMLDVEIVIKTGETRLQAAMRFVPDLNYPLMYIKEIEGL